MKFTSVPAWTFAGRHPKNNGKQDLPGPGNYNLSKFTTFQDSKGFSMGKTNYRNKKDGDGVVGPGAYNYNYSSFRNNGVTIKGGKMKLDLEY